MLRRNPLHIHAYVFCEQQMERLRFALEILSELYPIESEYMQLISNPVKRLRAAPRICKLTAASSLSA
ncbi:hypothetical protein AFLA_012702 [Aspergillus flavus NRRL3357]|nr:hypothetical protein AFLA_012702 [Aspergillus flavus NRRL3357]